MSVDDELASQHRYELQDRYLQLTREELPAVARRDGWSIREDHCFMRILLDRLFGDCWYHHLDRRLTAYKQLNETQLRRCIKMAEQLLLGDAASLDEWNQDSLRWRGSR
ncbi:MAG: hypothetical protein AAGJ83_02135 [Planctomycetota bacterium]